MDCLVIKYFLFRAYFDIHSLAGVAILPGAGLAFGWLFWLVLVGVGW